MSEEEEIYNSTLIDQDNAFGDQDLRDPRMLGRYEFTV